MFFVIAVCALAGMVICVRQSDRRDVRGSRRRCAGFTDRVPADVGNLCGDGEEILSFGSEKCISSKNNVHSSDINKAWRMMCYLMTIRRAKNQVTRTQTKKKKLYEGKNLIV